MKQFYHLRSFLPGLSIFAALMVAAGCDRFCGNTVFSFSPDWTVEHLDNSGATPVPAAGNIPAAAYGFRIKNDLVIESAAECGENWFSVNLVEQIRIFSTRDFDGMPAGSEVTNLFKARLSAGQRFGLGHTDYISVTEVLPYFSYPGVGNTAPFYMDFILPDGPAEPDSCAWNIQLLLTDSTIVNITTPVVFLQ